jgi:prepilin-type N-terminal cleavage/methylation domain-containing protein
MNHSIIDPVKCTGTSFVCCNPSAGRMSRGFVLTELLLAIAIVAVLGLIGVGVYQGLRGTISSDDMADKSIAMVAEIQKNWRNAGSYSSVSGAEINKLALIKSPMKFDGTVMQDAWGNTMSLNGGTTSFALTIGGAANPIDKDACGNIATKLAAIATNINIGQSASGASGQVSSGNAYKSGSTITQSGMTTGCSETATVIAAQFR